MTILQNRTGKNKQKKAIRSLLAEDDELIHIRKKDLAKSMWNALQKPHKLSNLNNKLYLLCKVCKLRLCSGQEMHEHINATLEILEHSSLGTTLKIVM